MKLSFVSLAVKELKDFRLKESISGPLDQQDSALLFTILDRSTAEENLIFEHTHYNVALLADRDVETMKLHDTVTTS